MKFWGRKIERKKFCGEKDRKKERNFVGRKIERKKEILWGER